MLPAWANHAKTPYPQAFPLQFTGLTLPDALEVNIDMCPMGKSNLLYLFLLRKATLFCVARPKTWMQKSENQLLPEACSGRSRLFPVFFPGQVWTAAGSGTSLGSTGNPVERGSRGARRRGCAAAAGWVKIMSVRRGGAATAYLVYAEPVQRRMTVLLTILVKIVSPGKAAWHTARIGEDDVCQTRRSGDGVPDVRRAGPTKYDGIRFTKTLS